MSVTDGISKTGRRSRTVGSTAAPPEPPRSTRSPLVALAVCVWFVLPLILTSPTDENVLMLAVVWALAALSLNVIWGYAGQFSMAQVALGGVSAYSYAILAVKAGWPISLALVGAVAMTVAVSACVALASIRHAGFRFAIMTLAFALAGVGLASSWSLTGQTEGLVVPPSWAVLNIGPIHWDLTGRDGGFAITASLVFLALTGALMFLLRTRTGGRLLAIREDHVLANSLGIDPARYRVLVFALSSVAAAAAGIFEAQYYTYISPTYFTFTTLVATIVVLVIGGTGRLFGPLVGGLVYAALTVALPISGDVQSIVFGVVLIGLTIFARSGLAYYAYEWQLRLWAALTGRSDRTETNTPVAASLDGAPGADSPLPALTDAAGDDGCPPRVVEHDHSLEDRPLALEARDLRKTYGGVTAVDGLSLEVRAGEILGIIGPNGAGKTTALNLLSGFARPDDGAVRWGGREITNLSPSARARRGLVRTFQQPRTFPRLTVRENLNIAGRTHGGLDDADGLMHQFGLSEFADRDAGALSYGSAKRLSIAMAVATGAELIMLDEPAAGLNQADIEHLVEDLRNLRDRGHALCLVEHHMDMITALCDRVLVLDAGRPLVVDVPDVVMANPRVIEAYLGAAS